MIGNLPFKKLSALTLMFGAIWISNSAMAGNQFTHYVEASSEYISGNLADARNSFHSPQLISTYDVGYMIYITAQQHDHSFASCITNDVSHMAQLRAANSDAWLTANISNGTCTNVLVVNSSENATKNH